MKKEVFIKQSSSVDRVSGESETVDDFKGYLESAFNNQKPEVWEIEKTEEDRTMLSIVLKEIPTFLEKYGGKIPPLTLEHFHAVDVDAEKAPRLKGDAGFQSKYQRIIYSPDALTLESRLSRAQTMAHEIGHFCSYQYYKEEETEDELGVSSGSRIGFKRVGLKLSGEGGNDLLEEVSGKLDEAVMDELAIRFIKELSVKEAWFLEDISSDSVGQVNDGDSLHELRKDESGKLYFQPNSHVREIKVLNNLIKYVVKNKPELYKSEEEVFDLFAKAALTNNLMPLVRALRKGMGKNWLSVIKLSLAN